MHFRKREKIRFGPVHPMAQRLIGEYPTLVQNPGGPDRPLFRPIKNNRTGALERPLDPGSVYRTIVVKYGHSTGIDAQVNGLCVHSPRAVAANALSHESDIAKARERLGHANVSTTRRYDRRKASQRTARHSG